MKTINSKWIVIFSISFILFQGCTADEFISEIEENTETNTTTETARVINNDIDLVIQWNDLLLVLDRYSTGMRPNATARALAYINLAAYETVVANENGYTSNERRLDGLRINQNVKEDNVNDLIALNKCYAEVMSHFIYNLPSNIESQIEDLEIDFEDQLADDVSTAVLDNSKEWGNYIAERIIAYSQTDTDAEEQILTPQPTSYEPPTGDGYWTYSGDPERALFPYWESVRTFVISSRETSSVSPMDNYSENRNSGYYAQMLEVYEITTAAKAENNEDLWVAEFWSDDVEGLMMSPPGRQISIANQLIEEHNLDMDEALVMLLKLGFSLNDAAVSTWADKYDYMVMRPSVYIKEFMDADFETNLYKFIYWPNPSFPGYPSGHSTFSSAAAGVFIDMLGDNNSFTDRSHEGRTDFLSTPRQFDSFSDMAEDNAYSRVPLGVHIRMDCTEGLRLGYEISDAVNDLNLRGNN